MKKTLIAVLLLILTTPAVAATSVGKVILSFGQNVAVSASGEQRTLKRQADIFEDDRLKTGAKGRLQIRFTDGSRLSLKPDSEFRIAEYQFDAGQPDSGKAIYQLLKGGMRTISGQIGKKNRENYELKTAVATIGIRGTHYGVEYTAEGIYAETVDGAIAVQSETGFATVRAGEGARVSGVNGVIQKGVATGQTSDANDTPSDTGEQASDADSGSGEQSESTDGETTDSGTAGSDQEASDSAASTDTSTADTGDGNLIQATADAAEGGLSLPAADPDQQTTISQSLLAVAPDPTGNGQPSPQGSLVAVAFTNIKSGEVKGSNGAVLVDDSSSITVDSTTAAGNLVTGIAYVDGNTGGEPCQPCIFTGPDTVSGVTASKALLGGTQVTWGRWNRGFSVTENGVQQNLTGSFHFMHADSLTTQAQLESLNRTGSYLYVFGGSSQKLTNPEIETGAQANLIPYDTGNLISGRSYKGTYVMVDHSSQMIQEVSILAQVDAGGGARTYHLTEVLNGGEGVPVALDTVLRGGAMNLVGTCSGADCTNVVTGTNTSLSGRLTFDFVGSKAEGAITSYGASGTKATGGDTSITGTVLLENAGAAPSPSLP